MTKTEPKGSRVEGMSSSTHNWIVSNPYEYRYAMTVARFDPSGKYVFVGTSGGYILVFNTRTKAVSAIIPILFCCAQILIGIDDSATSNSWWSWNDQRDGFCKERSVSSGII